MTKDNWENALGIFTASGVFIAERNENHHGQIILAEALALNVRMANPCVQDLDANLIRFRRIDFNVLEFELVSGGLVASDRPLYLIIVYSAKIAHPDDSGFAFDNLV
jgi:hypothetical protein